ncbi:MAG: inositol monophosphatase family protein [Patescibacteria group bacterium]
MSNSLISLETQRRIPLLARAVKECSTLALQAFNYDYCEVRVKPDGTKVTPWDTHLNELFILSVFRNFPNDTVIGEEAVFEPDDPTGYVWGVDPIDGTSGFIDAVAKKDPEQCESSVMAFLMAPGETRPAAAVVERISPVYEAFLVVKGMATEGSSMPPAQVVANEYVAGLYDYSHWGPEQERVSFDGLHPGSRRNTPSMGMAAARVVLGQTDFAVYSGTRIRPHDYVPAAMIAEHLMDGWVTDQCGRDLDEHDWRQPLDGLIIARDKKLGAQLVELLNN